MDRGKNTFNIPIKILTIHLQVGGSLGGLFTGIALKRLGHTVKIFERNPTPLLQNQGAGIVAGEDVQSFLKKYDLTKRQYKISCKHSHYLDREGNVIHSESTGMKTTSWDLMYYLLRAIYDGTPSKYCEVPAPVPGEGSVSYDYAYTVTNIQESQEGKIEVQYETKDGASGSSTADLVIGADGPSSTIRKMLLPDVKRQYTGYVAWRGTIPETEASVAAYETFTENTTYYHTQGIQILAYTIPGKHGTLEKGKRLINWVWYCNYPQDSPEFEELMTDRDGRVHQITLPAGKMSLNVWEQQKKYARSKLSPQFAEIVEKTEQPFIQAITDVTSTEVSFFDGKVRLIGDAVAGFRPHTASSTSQAAFDAEKLGELLRGEIDEGGWREEVMRYARTVQRSGIESGNQSQFGKHPLAR